MIVEVKKEKSGAVESVGMSTMEKPLQKSVPIVFFRAKHLKWLAKIKKRIQKKASRRRDQKKGFLVNQGSCS